MGTAFPYSNTRYWGYLNMHSAIRYHDFCAGHRVVGHEGKCRNLHGHNYRAHFHCRSDSSFLDELGRVVDFSVLKTTICEWIEANWDHKMLLWNKDEHVQYLKNFPGLFVVPFNPTAEHMAEALLFKANQLLDGTGITCHRVVLEETRKCSVEYNHE